MWNASSLAGNRRNGSIAVPSSRHPWGKFSDGASHHLAHHCADVAACFEAIAAQPCFRTALNKAAGRTLDVVTLQRLAVIAFLHDAGKLHPGFQARGWGATHGLAFHGHTGEGQAIFLNGVAENRIAQCLGLRSIQEWGSGDALVNLMSAVFAHHGLPVQERAEHNNGWGGGGAAGYDPVAAAQAIGRLLPQWFAPAFVAGGDPLPGAAAFQHLFCGLVALADWLGSDRSQFEYAANLDPSYMAATRARAEKAVRAIGLDTAPWRAILTGAPGFEALAPERQPRAAQATVGAWSLDDPLVILESETGSGKTEAALWRFARLFAAGKVEGLYFAVPTRAAARQLHGRVHAAMTALFGADAPQAVLAVPGYLKAGMHEGQALPQFQVLWDDGPDERRRLARWAAENARRFLAAPVAVGTVDQAMLAALQVKHAHLRAAALSRSLLVIDEVHASDNYMTEIQAHLLDTHLRRGGHAMLMSATLGSAARVRWLSGKRDSLPTLRDAIATPYPAVWGKCASMQAVRSEAHSKKVTIRLASSWSAATAAREAIGAARRGARVLVIRNTVGAAIATFNAVRELDGESLLMRVGDGPGLHHSRFAAEDRAMLDEAAQTALSPDATRRARGGAIVIGTQTLEQSLDICADFLISDLCPIDVLLQRIGRLHRHCLPRPQGFETPQCLTLSPEGGLAAFTAPTFENGLGMFKGGGGVYRNLHACELTRSLIEEKAEWTIPEMNRFLVESATHPEAIDALNAKMGRAWADYWNTTYGADLAEAQAGRTMLLDVATPFGDLKFPRREDAEERVRTRLGAEGARIEFAPGVIGPFGQAITAIACPAHWKGVVPDGLATPEYGPDGVLRFTVGDKRFVYGRWGLEMP